MRELRIAVTLLSCLVFCGPVVAQTKARQKGDSDIDTLARLAKNDKMIEAMILGAGRGVEGANNALSARREQRLYCPPAKLALTGRQFVSIFEKFVDDNPRAGEMGAIEVGTVMAMALVDVFPCQD